MLVGDKSITVISIILMCFVLALLQSGYESPRFLGCEIFKLLYFVSASGFIYVAIKKTKKE